MIEPADEFDRFNYATPFAGRLLVGGRSNLWLTDGTPEGTSVELTFPIDTVPFANVAGENGYFPRFTEEAGFELWAFRLE